MNTRIFTDASFVEEYLYDFEQSQFQQHRIPRALSCNIGFEQSFGNGRYFIMGKINNLTDNKNDSASLTVLYPDVASLSDSDTYLSNKLTIIKQKKK